MCNKRVNEYFAAGVKIDRNVREAALKDVVNIFNKNDIEYFLSYGTLLGIIREGRLLESDDDVDILVDERDFYKAYNLIKNKYSLSLNDNIFCSGKSETGKIELYKYISKGNKIIDLWSLKHNTPSTHNMDHVYPINTRYIQKLDIFANVPNDPENFLENIYANWRVPTVHKGYK